MWNDEDTNTRKSIAFTFLIFGGDQGIFKYRYFGSEVEDLHSSLEEQTFKVTRLSSI